MKNKNKKLIFKVKRPREPLDANSIVFFHQDALYSEDEKLLLQNLMERLKEHVYSNFEEIATDIEKLAEISRYSHKRCTKLSNDERLLIACSCIARKISHRPKPLESNSNLLQIGLDLSKAAENYSRYHGQKERRWNMAGCKYRLLFYKVKNGYRLRSRSILTHNHVPNAKSRKEYINQIRNIKFPLNVFNYIIKSLTELYVNDKAITSDIGRLLRDNIKKRFVGLNSGLNLTSITKKLFYLIIKKFLVQFSAIHKENISSTWDVYIYFYSFLLQRAANYLRHDSTVVIHNSLIMMKNINNPEDPKGNITC